MSTKEGEWYVLSLTVFLSRFVSQFWIYISEDRWQFVIVQWNSCAFRSQWLMGSVIFLLNQSFNENLEVLPFGACFKQREGSCLTYWVFFLNNSINSQRRVLCRSHQSDRPNFFLYRKPINPIPIRIPHYSCIANQSDCRIRVCIPYQSDCRTRVCIPHL